MRFARYDHGIIQFQNMIYCFGGRNLNGIPQKQCEKYSLITKKWEMIENMQLARHQISCCISKKNREIFVIGAVYIIEQSLLIEKYSIDLNSWSFLKIQIPSQINLRSFLNDPINVKLINCESNLYNEKQQLYFFATHQNFGDLSFLIDYDKNNQNSINRLKDVTLDKNSEIITKSYEIIIISKDNPQISTSYSLGNWTKKETIYRNSKL